MIDLTPIINAFIALLAAIAVRYAVPWIISKTDEQDRADLVKWAEIAVSAAQQIYHQFDGETRKAYALEVMAEHGFDVCSKEVDAAIEAAVLELHKALEGEK